MRLLSAFVCGRRHPFGSASTGANQAFDTSMTRTDRPRMAPSKTNPPLPTRPQGVRPSIRLVRCPVDASSDLQAMSVESRLIMRRFCTKTFWHAL